MSATTTPGRACGALLTCLALAALTAGPARANCALYEMEEAGHAGGSLALRGASLSPRFAGLGSGVQPDEFCADVAFDLDEMAHGRYSRRETPTSVTETVSLSSDRALTGGLETLTTGSRRLAANGRSETRLAQRLAVDGAGLTGSWASNPDEDRYGLAVDEDWMSGPGLSLSARHGIDTVHRRAGGEVRLAGLSSRVRAGYDGWSLALARSGPAPVGRTDIYEVVLGFPAQEGMVYPESTGIRTKWVEGVVGPVATWMDWSVFDTDFGIQASSADRREWTVGLGWRFPDPVLGALEINAGVNFDPAHRSERQVALAGEITW